MWTTTKFPDPITWDDFKQHGCPNLINGDRCGGRQGFIHISGQGHLFATCEKCNQTLTISDRPIERDGDAIVFHLNRKSKEKEGIDIPQKICPFLFWNTLTGYDCSESNAECGGCRFVGTKNDDGSDWEFGLEYDPEGGNKQ